MKRWLYIGLMMMSSSAVRARSNELDASLLHRAQAALTTVIVHDIFSPPVASRIYLYANMAAYETALPASNKYVSLANSITGFPKFQPPTKKGALRPGSCICIHAGG